MKGSKLFVASLVIFALTLGFFLGNICGKGSTCCCHKAEMACCKKMEGPCPRNGMMPPPPPPPHPGKFHEGPKGPRGDFRESPRFKAKFNPALIDSMLEVTPEPWAKPSKRTSPVKSKPQNSKFSMQTRHCWSTASRE